jgi:hypothetical protein
MVVIDLLNSPSGKLESKPHLGEKSVQDQFCPLGDCDLSDNILLLYDVDLPRAFI